MAGTPCLTSCFEPSPTKHSSWVTQLLPQSSKHQRMQSLVPHDGWQRHARPPQSHALTASRSARAPAHVLIPPFPSSNVGGQTRCAPSTHHSAPPLCPCAPARAPIRCQAHQALPSPSHRTSTPDTHPPSITLRPQRCPRKAGQRAWPACPGPCPLPSPPESRPQAVKPAAA